MALKQYESRGGCLDVVNSTDFAVNRITFVCEWCQICMRTGFGNDPFYNCISTIINHFVKYKTFDVGDMLPLIKLVADLLLQVRSLSSDFYCK